MRGSLRLSSLLVLSAILALPLLGPQLLSDLSFAGKDKDSLCETAEDCYASSLLRIDPASSREANGQIKLDRLKAIQERYPGSVWAKRAGLLIGLLLSEREPAEGIRYLRAAERDLPLLQDYIRLWTAEAFLNAGDAAEAARLLESLQEALPDMLRARAVFRSGEAWHRIGDCNKAIESFRRAVSMAPQDANAPGAWLKVADCQSRLNQLADSRTTLRLLWTRYPQTAESREAYARLTTQEGEPWQPSPDDLYARAQVFYGLSLHAEAVEELQKFLAKAGNHPRRDEARAKLGTALVRLKRYDQARQVFAELASSQSPDAGEAAVWLGRIHLRQDDGTRLLELRNSLPRLTLTAEQKSAILLFEGNWLEDHNRYDEAIGRYRQAAQAVKDSAQRLEPLWRIGWIHYRTAHYKEALEQFKGMLSSPEDPQFTPQALYWTARTLEQEKDPEATGRYDQLCQQFSFSYYCQLAQLRIAPARPHPLNETEQISLLPIPASSPDGQGEIVKDPRYRKAVELKILGREQDAMAELTSLIEQYARSRGQMLELCTLLGDAGAHHQALRLARLYFRDSLERGGEPVPTALWQVAYPMVYLPLIRNYAGSSFDPFLAAAIIREESQYDMRAVSRVGAIGLMQLMPTTAQTVAKSLGMSQVIREELFDRDVNIRFGVRYLEQLLLQFSGNLIYTIAAYNAGPPAVNTWIARYVDREPDEFVELIPYQETRQYVKRVLRSYREYRRLGGEECPSRFLDKVC